MIKLRNLHKYFFKGKRNEIHVVNDISLELEERGLVAIHGASGSGKTTLLNVIGGLDKVNSGEIDFYDLYIPKYKSSTWDKIRNEYVGYIFQNYYLLPELSVYENIRFVLKNLGIVDEKEIEYRVHYVLKALGIYPFRKKKALQLSGGQQQRVAIARALVKNPKVIIADEPTGNLDSKNTIEIMNIIKEISKETLVILVTHEKDIAEMYADRIIFLEDGKLINDVKNISNNEHNVSDDTIYLKDIKTKDNLTNDNVNVDVYYDKKLKDVNVKLILKNDTLYVDVHGYKNVKLVSDNTGVKIKDEHYVKKSSEEIIKTSYDPKELDHKHLKKEKGLLLPLKDSFTLAFKKLLSLGRKGKLVLFSFLIAGAIIAYGMASLFGVVIINPDKYMRLPKGYVSAYKGFNNELTKDDFYNLKGSTTNFYINPYNDNVEINFLNSDDSLGINKQTMMDFIEHAKNFKLIKGRYATDKNEIVISKGFADSFLSGTDSQDFGIWNLDGLLKEKIGFSDVNAKIVGVVDTNINVVFASEEFLTFNYEPYSNSKFRPLEAFYNIELERGTMPVNNNEILLNEKSVKELFGVEDLDEVTFPATFDLDLVKDDLDFRFEEYVITGVHKYSIDYAIIKLDTFKDHIIENAININIYSNNPKEIIKNLELIGLEGEDLYKVARDNLIMARAAIITGVLVSTLILVGATLVGFYFVIRSSLIGRIYEVAVYRSLGVKKINVLMSFLAEIVLITTITSFVGYSLISYLLYLVNKGFIGLFQTFIVNPLTFITGAFVVYILNLIAGLLPVLLLLRKTPAQILSQYDI